MSGDIVTFQIQLSSIMETILKTAVHEITCLVEGCFQGEVARSRKEVETLKQKLLLSERKWRSQEQRVRAKCVECGRAGVSTEETDPVPTGTESDEAGAKEKNNLGGGWNIVPFIVLDTEKAAVSVIRGQETTDHEDNLDIIHKGEVLKETKRLNDALKVVNEVIAPGRNESPTEPDLRKSEKEWDSTERNPVDVVVQALKAEPRDVHVSPNTALNKLQNETQSGHVKPELGTFNADFHISDNFYHVVQHNLSSEPSCSTIDVRDAFQGISCPMTPKRPNLNQSRIQSENEEDLVMHVPYDVGLWIPPDKNTENYISTNITENQQLCPYCQYTTSNLADLHVHLQSHSAEKHYTLSQLQTASPRGFHTKRQMDPRQDSAFSSYDGKKSRRNLERHPSLHRAGALHSCSECGKTFTRAYSLKIHHRSHTGERPYHCTHCKKGFISPTDLRRHKRIHTGEKPYTCMLCGRNFSYSCSLKKHQRIHTQEKPHCCIQCGKGFRCSGHLSTHMRIHTGEKPYACLLCGSKFSQSWTLKMHQRIHTQEKPHCCIQCGKSFRCSGDLSKHLRIHTGEKPYICNSCGKRYSQSQSLKSHKCLSDFKHTVNVNESGMS